MSETVSEFQTVGSATANARRQYELRLCKVRRPPKMLRSSYLLSPTRNVLQIHCGVVEYSAVTLCMQCYATQ